MWSLDELEPEIDAVRGRVLQLRRELGEYFVKRGVEIDLMILAAAAEEPLLLVGPPGTAKSDLIVKLVDSLGLGGDEYFEYMLTKFTEPTEILGPIDLQLLKEGRFVRRTRGKLPEARVAFLDEIFKSNSAILNTLLTIINERKYYQDGVATPVPLQILFGATNSIPEQSELSALADRFVLKVPTQSVQDTHFEELIAAGIANEAHKALKRKPWARGTATLDDFAKIKRFMDLMLGQDGERGGADRFFPRPIFAELRRLVRSLATEDKIFISDRKLIKLYKLIRTRAFLLHGGAVEEEDLQLLAYAGNRTEELALVEQKVTALLGVRERGLAWAR
jgi:MoxR-like ATPase